MTTDVRLKVGGHEYGGWKSVRVTRGIEAVSGSFDLSISERWPGQSIDWPIHIEDECTLLVAGEPMIVGYVDDKAISYDASSHSITVSGKDWTAALVECSADLDDWEFKNASILTLTQKLCRPFGIDVSLQDGLTVDAVSKLSVDPGETAFDALDRLCRLAGVLPVSDGAGGLLLTRAGSRRAVTELVEGKNILAASSEHNATGVYRSYRVLGQRSGSSETHGANAASVAGSASDLTVRRLERSLLVRADGNVSPAQAQTRAEWEATVRAGRAFSASVTVQGWTQGNGRPWPVNALVGVRSPLLGIDSDMLIAEATYTLDDGGSKTTLALKRPDAFEPEPVIEAEASAQRKVGTKKKTGQPWAELKGGV